MVAVTDYTLAVTHGGWPSVEYGPFGTNADAQEFAAKVRGPHRTATVTELSDPTQLVK
jgi:hypothetical protein